MHVTFFGCAVASWGNWICISWNLWFVLRQTQETKNYR